MSSLDYKDFKTLEERCLINEKYTKQNYFSGNIFNQF